MVREGTFPIKIVSGGDSMYVDLRDNGEYRIVVNGTTAFSTFDYRFVSDPVEESLFWARALDAAGGFGLDDPAYTLPAGLRQALEDAHCEVSA